jgi:hypothetical protein
MATPFRRSPEGIFPRYVHLPHCLEVSWEFGVGADEFRAPVRQLACTHPIMGLDGVC